MFTEEGQDSTKGKIILKSEKSEMIKIGNLSVGIFKIFNLKRRPWNTIC